jgi:2-phosphoglycerate kinase
MSNVPTSPPWKVLLIGGGSGVGKTTLAQKLAKHFDISLILADDVRLAIQQVTTQASLPDLHLFDNDQAAAALSAEQLCQGLITVAQAMSPALKMIAAHHVVVAGVGSIILEGDNVLPAMAAQHEFKELKHFWGLTTQNEIRSVFLYEPEEAALLQNMRDRGRGFADLSPDEQHRLAHASWLFGQWIYEEARRYDLPVVEVRPWDTLLERVLEVVNREL